jgi:hypothetical protein
VEEGVRRIAVKVQELRSVSDDELMERHDTLMERRSEHYNIFLDELARREAERQGERIEALTRSMNRLSWIATAATVVGAVVAGVGLWDALG